MKDSDLTRLSKFLCYVLRHRPGAIGLSLDDGGWVGIDDLLAACARHGREVPRDRLDLVVATDDKQRFAISADGLSIRASQGHSIAVDLGYAHASPPELLYHGTARRFLDSILERGLVKRSRHHVHLSLDVGTARVVGARHGSPVVLRVRAGELAAAGAQFFLSANGVWLTDNVPPSFLDVVRDTGE